MKRIFDMIVIIAVIAAVAGITRAVFADTVTGTMIVNPNITHTSTGASALKETVTELFTWRYSTNANDQITKIYVQTNMLNGSSNIVYDLSGSLSDSFGQPVSFTKVRVLAVLTTNSNYGAIGVGGAASNQWATWLGDTNDIVSVLPGSLLFIASPTTNGYAVSNAVSDLLSITNFTASNAYYSIIIGGEGI